MNAICVRRYVFFLRNSSTMAVFNWFSKQRLAATPAADHDESRRPAASPTVQAIDKRKQQRHARREQLYIAIREAMTRSGVLTTGYKFKVLSLDQIGDEFLVMVDLAQGITAGFDRLSEMEAAVIENASLRFRISVPTVYWRLTGAAVIAAPRPHPRNAGSRDLLAAGHAPASSPAAGVAAQSAVAARPRIDDKEIVAFNRALLAASSKSRPGSIEETVRLGSKALAYPPLMDFADTEMTDSAESAVVSALGKTQYGDLN